MANGHIMFHVMIVFQGIFDRVFRFALRSVIPGDEIETLAGVFFLIGVALSFSGARFLLEEFFSGDSVEVSFICTLSDRPPPFVLHISD